MKAIYRIEFVRELTAGEIESYWPDEHMAPDETFDETEFDAEGHDKLSMMADLFNLFIRFITENSFENVEILEIEEV